MAKRLFFAILVLGLIFSLSAIRTTSSAQVKTSPVAAGASGRLVYQPDKKGNRIPDFSYCGYKGAADSIPDVPVRVVVPALNGDATGRIQQAIDYVSSLPLDKSGFRGTVLLKKGIYKLYGRLEIRASGIVLRGSGMTENGTTIVAKGKDRAALIRVYGKHNIRLDSAAAITDAYVPVGSDKIHVADGSRFKQGDHVMVYRNCTAEWIDTLGVADFGGESGWIGWKPGEEVITWDRKITAVHGNELTLNIALTTAIDSAFGGGTVAAYHWPGRIEQIGIENLRLVSDYDSSNLKDEAHCWMGVTLAHVRDAWVRQVIFKHFAGSAVYGLSSSSRVTVQDCKSLAPVSEIGGERRYAFRTDGQLTLFQSIYSEYGYHDFTVGFCAAGPNAFVQCKAHLPFSFSGPVNSWASGVLYDNVRIDGGALVFKNLGQYNRGAGWNAANSVFWQCDAAKIACYQPPTAENWAFGSWAQPEGHGYWGHTNEHVEPFSLYYAQLKDRLGQKVIARGKLLQIRSNPTSSPTIKEAGRLSALAAKPAPRLSDWIDAAAQRDPIPTQAKRALGVAQLKLKAPRKEEIAVHPMALKNGWLVRDGKVMTGTRTVTPWWRGDVQPGKAREAKPAITRFVPGRIGRGYTDDLAVVADSLKENQVTVFEQNYGLWYDRRRDDHLRVRRMNGNVWAPFYVLPFKRSGKGLAWDGLSKYDLTKYNYWYWNRLEKFARLADQKGLVLIHKNYFQHNIIEAGAHWVDFPWRTANNINHVGFPEPPPFAGDKRIFMAQQFYDTTNLVRKKLHIAYIKKCLDNFKNNSNVIQFTAAEYTGPLSFVQFWLDVIIQWEKETGKNEFIGLSTTKDVQDAVLSDPQRGPIVDVIDIRHWHYEKDSTLYAPEGGQSLAPRQFARLLHPKGSSFGQVYRAVRTYREKYPDKAVMYSYRNYNHFGWAVFMASGSLATIPQIEADGFLQSAAKMHIADLVGRPKRQWVLADEGKAYIVYNASIRPVQIDLSSYSGRYKVTWINPDSGRVFKRRTFQGGGVVTLKKNTTKEVVLWITKK